jgi:hypothetical protein
MAIRIRRFTRVKSAASVVMAALWLIGSTFGCSRRDAADEKEVFIDLNKMSGINVCPDRALDLPRGNIDLSILLPRDTPAGKYDVVVYRASNPPQSVGQTANITTEADAATLRVNLKLAALEPGPYTLAISTRPKVSYCEVRLVSPTPDATSPTR